MPFQRHGGHSTTNNGKLSRSIKIMGPPLWVQATRSVTSSRIAPPSDATILDGQQLSILLHCHAKRFMVTHHPCYLTGLLFMDLLQGRVSRQAARCQSGGWRALYRISFQRPGAFGSFTWVTTWFPKQLVSGGDFADHFRTRLPATELSLLFLAFIKWGLPESFFQCWTKAFIYQPESCTTNQHWFLHSLPAVWPLSSLHMKCCESLTHPSASTSKVEAHNDIGGFASYRRAIAGVCQLFALLHSKGLW